MEVGYVSGVAQTNLKTDVKDKKCYNCGRIGHLSKECRSTGKNKGKGDSKGSDGKSFKGLKGKSYTGKGDGKSSGKVQKEQRCFQCGKVGHMAQD